MENAVEFSYIFAILVGITLGLIGSGGSILTVPILVYVVGLDAVVATGYSLFIVGVTALVGTVRNWMGGELNLRAVVLFGVPSLIAAFLVRRFAIPEVPETLVTTPVVIGKDAFILVLFALVMAAAAYRMIFSTPTTVDADSPVGIRLIGNGVAIGILAGTVGAGGGFLIVPALIFAGRLTVKSAIASSLAIIAIQSLAGFAGDMANLKVDWNFLMIFSAFSVLGVFLGKILSRRFDGERLKKTFGYFLLVMAATILVAEITG